MRILVDLDEVLADFVGAALNLHGWTLEKLLEVKPKGQWDIVEPMGLTTEQFWHPIYEMGEAFWSGLKLHPWAMDLIAIVRGCTSDWYIVSSPSRSLAAYAGKIKWLKRIFGQHFTRYVITNHKHLLAKEEVVLIDDSSANLLRFIAAGGSTILFPSPGNSLEGTDPIEYVKNELRILTKQPIT